MVAREHFFLDNQEDTIHSNQIELKTAKEKRANWWYYHKIQLGVIVVIVAIAVGIVYSVVSKVEPDYTIGLLTQDTYISDIVTRLEEELTEYADDRNGDGQVIVKIAQYAVGSTSIDPQIQQANTVRFMGDASNFDSVIYLCDSKSLEWAQTQAGGFFTYTDGTTPEEGATDYENMKVNWEDCKGLTDMDLTLNVLTDKQVLAYMGPLGLSIRSVEGTSFLNNEDDMEYYRDCQALAQRLIDGEKIEKSKETESK